MMVLRFLPIPVVLLALAPGALADTLEAGEPADLLTVEPAAEGLTRPTSFAFLPDGRMVITEKGGEVLLRETDGSRRNIGTFPVDDQSEKGLLNVLVHPDFATNRRLIFYYSASGAAAPPGTSADRHRVVTVPLDQSFNLDFAGEQILVRGLRGPANHDGGAIAIGPDGKLYVGVGDTGCNSRQDPEPPYTPTNYFATCLTNGNGKILRVDLDGSIPSDNPLVGQSVTACGDSCGDDATALPLAPAREDIWAWGFRNPWRFSFHSATGNLWVGDVGEVSYEEVHVIPPSGGGRHYGWPWREGLHGHPASACDAITPGAPCVDPQYECRHGGDQGGIDGNCSAITGGVVVDSCAFPDAFRGRYFFGDSSQGWVATLNLTGDRNGVAAGSRRMVVSVDGGPVHFGVGPDGALYYSVIADPGSSAIQRLFPLNPEPCAPTGAGGAPGNAGGANAGNAGGANAGNAGGPSGTGGGAIGGAANGAGGTSSAGGPTGSGATGAGPDAGAGASQSSKDDGGCGCRVDGRGGAGGAAPVLFGSLLAFGLLRRRHGASISRSRRSRR